jgi:hypothetical protein
MVHPTYVYAIGKIEARFPRLSIEKEFAQAVGNGDFKGRTDSEVFYRVLSDKANRYLARQLCWVMTIEGLETYLLVPRDLTEMDILIESIRPAPNPMDIDMVIGVKGPNAPSDYCNGLMVPIVLCDQLYSFDRDTLVKAIPRPEKSNAKEFNAAATEILDRILQIADNAGATDEHRALNYLAVRYPGIYTKAAQAFGDGYSLSEIEVQTSRLSGARKIMTVVFSYVNRQTGVIEQYYTRVDVTEQYPFLVTKLTQGFGR